MSILVPMNSFWVLEVGLGGYVVICGNAMR